MVIYTEYYTESHTQQTQNSTKHFHIFEKLDIHSNQRFPFVFMAHLWRA